jgi:hypothetical protein
MKIIESITQSFDVRQVQGTLFQNQIPSRYSFLEQSLRLLFFHRTNNILQFIVTFNSPPFQFYQQHTSLPISQSLKKFGIWFLFIVFSAFDFILPVDDIFLKFPTWNHKSSINIHIISKYRFWTFCFPIVFKNLLK